MRLVSILPLFLLFSCGDQKERTDDRTVFRYNEAAGISSLDPAFAKDLSNIWACNQLYNGLVGQDSDLEIVPSVARSWEISEEGTVYTFHLRGDVFFHENEVFGESGKRKVTAGDFVYSFNRILDPATASPGAWVFRNVKMMDDRPSFTAVNDSTLRITLDHPFPPFLGILSMQYCAVVPREAMERYGKDFRQHPVGTGPFRFKMWKEGIKLVFVKNEDYFERDEQGRSLPYLDAVAVSFLIDKQSAFLEFIKGNLDFISGIDPTYKDEILTPAGDLNPAYSDRIDLVTEPFLNTEYLGMLVSGKNEKDPLLSKDFRKALNYGFDRSKMIVYLRNGIGTPGRQGIIPRGMPAWNENGPGYAYDPARARQHLALAGYGPDRPVPAIQLYTTADYLDICEYIQHQLGELGIPLEIEVTPSGTLRELKAQSRVDFFRASWVADYPDEENYLSLFYSRNFSPGGPNYTHFSDPVFDSLYELSQGTVDRRERQGLYREMDSIIMAEAPVIILYYDQVLRFTRKNVRSLGSNPMNLLDLRRVFKQ